MTASAPIQQTQPKKLSPQDPSLALRSKNVRTLNKTPIIIAFSMGFAIVLLAMSLALQPVEEVEEEVAPVISEESQMPAFLRNAPERYVVPETKPAQAAATHQEGDCVPVLGKPLQGDMGPVMHDGQVNCLNQQATHNERKHDTTGKTQYTAQTSSQQANTYSQQYSSNGYNSSYSSEQARRDKEAKELEEAMNADFFVSADGSNSSSGSISNAFEDYKKDLSSQLASNEKIVDRMINQYQSQLNNNASRQSNYVSGSMTAPRSPFEVKAGSIIPVSLITGINSDLPGDIIGQVRENVYDTVTGRHLLIPQGSRLMATYNDVIGWGQDRIQVCWNRLIRPDGSSINLECMSGADLAGNAGFKDTVDRHTGRIIGGIILSSFLPAARGKVPDANVATYQEMVEYTANERFQDAGREFIKKNLSAQDTVKIRPGFSVNVIVNKDMIIPPFNG